jgi:Uma2 family endonuclease
MASRLRPPPLLSHDDYLAVERDEGVRLEYIDGAIRMMVNATRKHGIITANLIGELRSKLANGPCIVVEAQTKLRIEPLNSSYYPDVMVYCDSAAETDEHAVHHPSLLAEVLSDSTAQVDRREKVKAYKTIESLRYLLIVDPRARCVEIWSRSDDTWIFRETGVVPLPDIDASLKISEVFAKVPYDSD